MLYVLGIAIFDTLMTIPENANEYDVSHVTCCLSSLFLIDGLLGWQWIFLLSFSMLQRGSLEPFDAFNQLYLRLLLLNS